MFTHEGADTGHSVSFTHSLTHTPHDSSLDGIWEGNAGFSLTSERVTERDTSHGQQSWSFPYETKTSDEWGLDMETSCGNGNRVMRRTQPHTK